MSVGEPDDRPNFELVNPPTMALLMTQTERTRVIEKLKHANVWRKFSCGGGKRHYARDIYSNKNKDLLVTVTNAPEWYVHLVQKRYPKLKYVKFGALWSELHAESQFQASGNVLHSDYNIACKVVPPEEWPISIIVGLDEFMFMFLEKLSDER
jgi:hypothetical protein